MRYCVDVLFGYLIVLYLGIVNRTNACVRLNWDNLITKF